MNVKITLRIIRKKYAADPKISTRPFRQSWSKKMFCSLNSEHIRISKYGLNRYTSTINFMKKSLINYYIK